MTHIDLQPSILVPTRVSVLSHFSDLQLLEPDWRELAAADPHATPFQGPEWLLSWWRYRSRGRLQVLTLHAGSRLVGLAPFCVRDTAGVRRLELAGTGGTDYLDVLAHPEYRQPLLRTLGEYLEDSRGEWDVCDLQQLRAVSPLRELVRDAGGRPRSELRSPARKRTPALQDGAGASARSSASVYLGEFAGQIGEWSSVVYAQEVAPVLTLAPGDDLPRTVPKRMRGNVRYYQRRLDAEGPSAMEPATLGTLDEHLEALFRLHQARWRRRWQPGAFADRRVRAQHQEFARALAARNRLRLWCLRLNGEILASLYCFRDEHRLYYYAAGFDPRLAHCSPGTLLLAHAIVSAQTEGLTELDFLRGNEAYKYAWGAQDRQNYRLAIWKPGVRGAVGRALIAAEMQGEWKAKALSTRLNQWRRT